MGVDDAVNDPGAVVTDAVSATRQDAPAPVARLRTSAPRRALAVVTSVVFLGFLPIWPLYVAFETVIAGHGIATDFRNTFYPAAEAVLHGANPYPHPDDAVVELGRAYVYPPLAALATVPLTAVSASVAEVVVMALLVLAVVVTLRVLGVTDWRCYGLVFLWPPFLAAVKTGNITAFLGLGAALTWRYRDRPSYAGAAAGIDLAAKIFLWPLLLWLAAARRLAAAGLACAVAAVVLVGSWTAIGFAGLADYPDLLRHLQDIEAPQSYTVYALGLDLGAPGWAARTAWAAVALVLLAATASAAWRGRDELAFILAIAAALACSPIVWLNYFVLLVLVVAVSEPRLGLAWFVPLVMYASASTENGTTSQNALTLVAAVVTFGLAVRRLGRPKPVVRPLTTPAAAPP
jgi:hypothetical protein